MAMSAVEQIIERLRDVPELYHRLVLLVGPAGSGKTKVLREIESRTNGKYVNVNLELSQRMLELTSRQRALQVGRLLTELTDQFSEDVLLFDNIEILFDAALKQDPLRLLQSLSRNRTLVAAWCGTIEDNHLTYAVPDHPEYRRYPVQDLVIVASESAIPSQES